MIAMSSKTAIRVRSVGRFAEVSGAFDAAGDLVQHHQLAVVPVHRKKCVLLGAVRSDDLEAHSGLHELHYPSLLGKTSRPPAIAHLSAGDESPNVSTRLEKLQTHAPPSDRRRSRRLTPRILVLPSSKADGRRREAFNQEQRQCQNDRDRTHQCLHVPEEVVAEEDDDECEQGCCGKSGSYDDRQPQPRRNTEPVLTIPFHGGSPIVSTPDVEVKSQGDDDPQKQSRRGDEQPRISDHRPGLALSRSCSWGGRSNAGLRASGGQRRIHQIPRQESIPPRLLGDSTAGCSAPPLPVDLPPWPSLLQNTSMIVRTRKFNAVRFTEHDSHSTKCATEPRRR